MRFWVMNNQGSYGLFIRGEKGAFVNVASVIATYGCQGPVARMVANNLGHILSAAQKKPGSFRNNATAGVSLVKLLRTADAVNRPGRSRNGRLHPFPTRR